MNWPKQNLHKDISSSIKKFQGCFNSHFILIYEKENLAKNIINILSLTSF